jgi:hypothetical protein
MSIAHTTFIGWNKYPRRDSVQTSYFGIILVHAEVKDWYAVSTVEVTLEVFVNIDDEGGRIFVVRELMMPLMNW